MTFGQSIRACLSGYVTFSGRAGRPEYWWFVLFTVLGTTLFSLLDSAVFTAPAPDGKPTRIFAPLWQLAMFLPLLAAGWRRLHDTGRPGWYILIPKLLSLATVLLLLLGVFAVGVIEGANPDDIPSADPVLGVGVLGLAAALALQLVVAVIMIYWLTRPSQPEVNAYGPPVSP